MSGSNSDKTNGRDGGGKDTVDHGVVDHVLGEGTAAEREEFRERLGSELEFAVEAGELRVLLGEMRGLTVEPTGHVGLAVRYAVRRHVEHQPNPVVRWRRPLGWRLVQVAAVAAASLLAFVWVDRVARHASVQGRGYPDISSSGAFSMVQTAALGDGRASPVVDSELARLLSRSRIPVQEPAFLAALGRYESLPLPESFHGWIDAARELERMRDQFRLRFSRTERRSVLRSAGAPDLDHRLEALASAVAKGLDADLDAGSVVNGEVKSAQRQPSAVPTSELAIGLRALLAAGSSRFRGVHQATVRDVSRELEARLAGPIDDGSLASVLAALSDLAVMEGGHFIDLVGFHADQLARRTLETVDGGRPRLLHWQTPAAQLADAGRVLRLAPGFGVHAAVAFRARMMIAAHLEERMQGRPDREAPGLVAASLYGFGDIIDRASAERALQLWRPELLMPNFVTLHHIAWSKTPTRFGWAEFQQELRALASVSTPESTRDAAALFLCLSMNFAGPGAGILIG